jgi:hypothetical protein
MSIYRIGGTEMKSIEYAWLQISDLHTFDNTELNTLKAAYQRLPYNPDSRKRDDEFLPRLAEPPGFC